MLAQTAVHDTTIQVAIISTIGLVVVALISIFTAKITSGARKESQTSAENAFKSAEVVKDYAAALEAKNALIDSLEQRIEFLDDFCKIQTETNQRQEERIKELELRIEEGEEQRRASHIIERSQQREISELRSKLGKVEKSK